MVCLNMFRYFKDIIYNFFIMKVIEFTKIMSGYYEIYP